MNSPASGLILILLLTGMLVLGFNIQSSKAGLEASIGLVTHVSSWQGFENKWGEDLQTELDGLNDLDRLKEWSLLGFDWGDNESAKLIVGVDVPKHQIRDLEEMIASKGGNVSNMISVDDNVKALTVKVPPENAFSFTEELRAIELVKYVEPDSKVEASYTPNDPYWSQQWGPKKIEVNIAWDTTIGSSDILVAIIDTGIDYTHNDLTANYVSLGYDWVNNDTDPMDDHGHGTHCAGIVAAKLNNSVGIAGLAQVSIMAEKVLDNNGYGYWSWLIQSIYHATDCRARIISMSLIGESGSEALHYAVKYAYDHGVLLVAAAGNSGDNTMYYPAVYNEVVAVSATDSSDNLATFSTFGDWIELSAPGVNIYSTLPGDCYSGWSGTSMACPHVTGVAALAWSAYTDCTVDQIRWLLQHTADDLGYVGLDEYYGYGRVNARKAVSLLEHDIGIIEWRYPYRVDPGQPSMFNATIANYGRKNETNISVQFFVNETLIGFTTIDFLKVCTSTTISFSWNATIMGNYNVTCHVIPVPYENYTENNVMYANVAVRFPTTFRVPNDYPTIKAAVKGVGDGDTVLVCEGYYAVGQIDILRNSITLVADGFVTLDGQGGCYVLNARANHVTVEGFDIWNSTSYGINMKGFGNTVAKNLLHCASGIRLERSCDSIIKQNHVVTSGIYGIVLHRSSNNTIIENVITGGIRDAALHVYYSEKNFISLNNITGNRFGLVLKSSRNNVLRNNRMANNWCNFAHGTSYGFWDVWPGDNDIDASNTVDGKPIYYWVNVSDRVVPSDAGCVVLSNCENIIVENLDIRNNFHGILLVNSSSIQIRRNNITHNFANYDNRCAGILAVCGSSNVTVTLNNITANDNGVFLLGANNNVSLNNIANNFFWGVILSGETVLSSNNITGSLVAGVELRGSGCIVTSNNIGSNSEGIRIYGSNHTLISNNIIANGIMAGFAGCYGINIYQASNCTIRSNNIILSGEYGIYMREASSNVLFHNNFIDNNKQVYIYKSTNVWDDGYPSGGNYWSNYTGLDNYNGPNQDLPGADGIGDTPHTLDASNVDRYPLMNSCTENPPPQTCSLTITGWIGNNPTEGFYNTPRLLPGTYVFMANSTIQVDTHLSYSTFVDHWELDGVNVGSDDFIIILMDKDHNLTAFLSVVPPLDVSISPTTAKIKIGSSVTFLSSLSGGKPPYEYQWHLDGREIWEATSSTWTFKPKKLGTYTIYLKVRYPFSTLCQSETAFVTVKSPPTVSISPTSASIPIGESVKFTSSVLDGFSPYTYQWYLNNKHVSGATASEWTFTPNASGEYLVYLNVTDSIGTTAKSDEALVTVAPQLIVSISPTSDSIHVSESVQFTSTVSGGYPPYIYQWYLGGIAVPEATSSNWTFTPATSGIYYVHLKVTDLLGKTTESETARITVTSIAVGGYSFPIEKFTIATPLTPYLALITILTVCFTAIRRKTK